MNLPRLEETWGRLVKANGTRWYEQVLKRNNDDVFRELDF